MDFWACWCSRLFLSTPQARFFVIPIRGGGSVLTLHHILRAAPAHFCSPLYLLHSFLFSLVMWYKGKKSSEKKKIFFVYFFSSLELPLGKFILSITGIKWRPSCQVFFKIDNKWNIRSECDWVFLILFSWLA